MRIATAGLLGLLCLSACQSSPDLSAEAVGEVLSGRSAQVARDVQAINAGMNHARAQSEAYARARTP